MVISKLIHIVDWLFKIIPNYNLIYNEEHLPGSYLETI